MIEFKNVTKNYARTTALNNFSIKINKPGIYCLLGRNGAGKTTMLKTLAGHIVASSGTVLVNNSQVSTFAMPAGVHYIESDASQFNIKLDDLFRAAADINPLFDVRFALEIAERFQLDRKKRYKQLSFGMKAMVNTLIAMSSGREILLLDEPVLGFDPVMRRIFYDMLQESNAVKPKTIIVSTHIIDEISKVAEQLIIIDSGKLVLFCDINEIDEKAYCVTGTAENVKMATKGLRVLSEMKAGGFLSQYIYDLRINESDKYSITALGLQDFFISLVGGDKEAV